MLLRTLRLSACLVLLSGCQDKEASSVGAASSALPTGAAVVQAAGDAPPDISAAPARVDNEHYTVELVNESEYAAGRVGQVTINIRPKHGYHINEQYPFKFRVGASKGGGFKYPKQLLTKEDGDFSRKELGVLHIPFESEKQGTYQIGGELSLSVCSEANCLVEKQKLAVNVKVY